MHLGTGFLPFGRGSFVIDFVVVALVLVVPLFSYSLYLVKVKRNYLWHKRLQVLIASALGLVIIIFELDIRLNGWRHLAEPSPFYNTILFPVLIAHLVIAISTVAVWVLTIYRALKFFPSPPSWSIQPPA